VCPPYVVIRYFAIQPRLQLFFSKVLFFRKIEAELN